MYLIHKIRVCEYSLVNSKEAELHYKRLGRLAKHLAINEDDLVEHLNDGKLVLRYGLIESLMPASSEHVDAWWWFRDGEKNAAICIRTGVIIDGLDAEES